MSGDDRRAADGDERRAVNRDDPAAESGDARAACGTECDEALERLEAYLDGELPESEFEDIKDHLTECYPCTDRATFEEQLRAIVRRGCADAAPPQLVARIRSRLAGGDPER